MGRDHRWCCSVLRVAHMPLVDRCISSENSDSCFRIFSTCVILICTCRRNLLLLKCLHLLNTWSCPAATRSSTAVAEKWCGEALHLPTSWILIYSALNRSNQWLQSPREPPVFLCLPPGQYSFLTGLTHTYQNNSQWKVSELLGPHLLSFMWLSVRVLQHIQQHILEGSEGVCS